MTRTTMQGPGPRRIEQQLQIEKLERELSLPAPPPGGWVEHAPIPVDVVHARVAVTLVIPRALQVECEAHGASRGVPCWGSTASRVVGVCDTRLARRAEVES